MIGSQTFWEISGLSFQNNRKTAKCNKKSVTQQHKSAYNPLEANSAYKSFSFF